MDEPQTTLFTTNSKPLAKTDITKSIPTTNDKIAGYIYGSNTSFMKNDTLESFNSTSQTDSISNHFEGVEKSMEKELNNLLFNELKTDMREREARTREELNSRETRQNEMIKGYMEQSEKREERFNENLKEIKQLLQTHETKMDAHIKHFETIKSQNFWGNIAMFIGMLGVVAAITIAMIFY